MNSKTAKKLRQVARQLGEAGGYDAKRIYKTLKALSKNREATVARLKAKSCKPMVLSDNVLEREDGTNT